MLVPEAGTVIAGRYRLERQLGEGGMGSVWAATDDKLRREVAIKLVTERIADSERALARFEREAMSVARLRSPYIAQVYDYGVEDGSPYIIMELLHGEDLKATLARSGRMSLPETARVVVQIAKALHAAHASGTIHRDLKPANVFVTQEHGEEVCKVFDFGVAKALNDLADDGETTAEGVLLGTPRYMSPEQAHGAKQVDHRSDLWALGVIAYVCLTGRLPFVAAGTGHVLVKICTEDPPPPSSLVEGYGAEVDAFFQKALAKDPAARFQSAKELGTAFAELAEMSLSSFSLARSSSPRPSWGGHEVVSGMDADSFATASEQLRASGARPQVVVEDGTLGPATTSVKSRGLLASRGARLGLALVLAAGAVGLLAIQLGGASGTGPTAPSEPKPDEGSPAEAETPIEAPSASAAPTPAPTTSASATAAASVASSPPPRRARPVPVAPSAKPSAKPADTPAPKPTPKPTGDGLDLFDKRF
ncbi:MAG: serine/threonine-protein kinase [Polyangiaceae bacterium]